MPVRPEIALGVKQPQFLTPADAISLRDLATQSDLRGMQMEDAQEARRDKNALRQIYGNAANLDTETGGLKSQAISQVGAVNPALAGKLTLDQLTAKAKAVELKAKEAEVAERQGKIVVQKETYLNDNVRGPAFAAYEAALPQGEEVARRAGQAAFTQGIEAAARSGMFSIEEKGQFDMSFDPQRVSQRLQQSKDWIAQRGANAERVEKERHNRATEAQRLADSAAAERRAREAVARSDAKPPKDPTDAQNVAAGYASRMTAAEKILSPLEEKGVGKPGLIETAVGSSKTAANVARDPERQKYRQAQEDWVRAKLRKESGAVIGDEEMDREIRVYFPQIGDEPGTIKQKKAARKVATEAMHQSAGRAPVQEPAPEARKTINGKNYIKQGGKWFEE